MVKEILHERMLKLKMFLICFGVLVWNVVVCNGEGRINTAMVTGMVFCDQYSLESLSALSHPLAGAEVRLECKQGLKTDIFQATTDDNGVFSISVDGEYGLEIHGSERKCSVQVASSNDIHCQVPTDMDNGVSGTVKEGVYEEKTVYYVGLFVYRMNHPLKICNALNLSSRKNIRLQVSFLPHGSPRSSSFRGLKTVIERELGDGMPTIPSTAVTIPFTWTKSPSLNLRVSRPTPIADNQIPTKFPKVPGGNNSSPRQRHSKCVPLPPIPLYSNLSKLKFHYPLCKNPLTYPLHRPPSPPHHGHPPSRHNIFPPSSPPQPSTVPMPSYNPHPPIHYHKLSPLPKHPTYSPQFPSIPMNAPPIQYHRHFDPLDRHVP